MARETGTGKAVVPAVTAEDVANYLRAHPDFLAENPQLLETLRAPSAHGGDIVDLRQFMVERLRGEVGRLRDQQAELVDAARANMTNQERVHAAVLYLLDARSFEQFIHILTNDLALMLELDVVTLVIEASGPTTPSVQIAGVHVVETDSIDTLMMGRSIALHADITGDPALYGPAAGLVRSEALVQLEISHDTPPGLLAFGSRDPHLFQDGQATDQIAFLARVIERCARAWLDLPTA